MRPRSFSAVPSLASRLTAFLAPLLTRSPQLGLVEEDPGLQELAARAGRGRRAREPIRSGHGRVRHGVLVDPAPLGRACSLRTIPLCRPLRLLTMWLTRVPSCCAAHSRPSSSLSRPSAPSPGRRSSRRAGPTTRGCSACRSSSRSRTTTWRASGSNGPASGRSSASTSTRCVASRLALYLAPCRD